MILLKTWFFIPGNSVIPLAVGFFTLYVGWYLLVGIFKGLKYIGKRLDDFIEKTNEKIKKKYD